MRTTLCFCPRFATISVVPESGGQKPKRNENNRCVTQQHNKLLSNGAVLSIMVHKQLVRFCLGVNGPLTKVTCID